jgi:hypothetical protein
VAVWFFGTREMGCFKPADITSFSAGLEQELHTKCKRSVKIFHAALQETFVYLQVPPM